jgi:hypothetical protein
LIKYAVQVCLRSKQKKPRDGLRSFLGEFRVAFRKSRSMTYGVALDFGLGSNDADKLTAFIALNLKYDFAVGRCE